MDIRESQDSISSVAICWNNGNRSEALHLQIKILLLANLLDVPFHLVLHANDRADKHLSQVRVKVVQQVNVVVYDVTIFAFEADNYTCNHVTELLFAADLLQHIDNLLILHHTDVQAEAQPTDFVWLLPEF